MDPLDQSYELRSPSVISDEVDGETLAINLDTGLYYVIPPASAPVWRALRSGTPGRALARADDARSRAIEAFLAALLEAGLLRPAVADAGTAEPADVDVDVDWDGSGLELEVHEDLADLLGLDPIHDADDALGWPTRNITA